MHAPFQEASSGGGKGCCGDPVPSLRELKWPLQYLPDRSVRWLRESPEEEPTAEEANLSSLWEGCGIQLEIPAFCQRPNHSGGRFPLHRTSGNRGLRSGPGSLLEILPAGQG